MQKIMQNHKTLKKFKTSFFLTSILAIGIFISPFAFAENPLVTQAKELQTGSENVGIDHQKAIALLKKASDEGDAEAMYLLSQYYNFISAFRYLPENPYLNDELRISAAKKGNWDAIDNLISEVKIQENMFQTPDKKQIINALMPLIIKGVKERNSRAFLAIADLNEQYRDRGYNLKQCDYLNQGLQTGDIWGAGYRMQFCEEEALKKLKLPSTEEFKNKYIQQLKDAVGEYKLVSKPSIGEKIILLERFGNLELDKNLSTFKDNLNREIKNFYLSQAKKGYSDAYLKLADEYLGDKNHDVWIEKAAALNNRIAITDLGYNYLYGENGSKQNVALGRQYLEKAIVLNDPIAMGVLGTWLYNESEDQEVLDHSIELLKSAAELDSLNAMENLSKAVAESDSYFWAVEAYKNGTKEQSILEIAYKAYSEGLGVPKDKVLADRVQKKLKNLVEKEETRKAVFGI
ncbi:sel1 repeat family protein [Acinetobacter sp. 256-1]|uniref:tetratricopeptide repeat protein n=1 Tax=Acinetobacter sp. 256-1 TaxID=2746721 RepID=UPI002577E72C|nr:sel1 repeat family protein [Acinetobacter sp. 256-1]MDM1757806.1 sel1 repeat family protein [Acinetobacter sp. 256-1]